jgi:hypothetical protein
MGFGVRLYPGAGLAQAGVGAFEEASYGLIVKRLIMLINAIGIA